MTWSFNHISNYLPRDTWESFVDHYVAAGMMLGVLAICLSYTAVHRLLHHYAIPYRQLDKDKQLVVVHHTIEAIFLSLLFLPLTYLVASINFEEQPIDQLHRKVSALGIMMFTIIIMYMVELASRYQANRPLVVAHHLCAYADSVFPAFSLTTANLKASSLLVYFITYEAVIFMRLVLYRLYPAHKATSRGDSGWNDHLWSHASHSTGVDYWQSGGHMGGRTQVASGRPNDTDAGVYLSSML